MADLTGSNETHQLGDGITLTAPGIQGMATYDGTTPPLVTPAGRLLHHALGNAGFARRPPVVITHETSASDAVQVSFPPPRAGHNALLMVHDSTGGLTWHRPDQQTAAAVAFAAGADSRTPLPTASPAPDKPLTFTLHAPRFTTEHAADSLGSRVEGLVHHFGGHHGTPGISKALSVLEYPIAHLAAWGATTWFDRWDRNKHPTVIRWFPPTAGQALGEPISPTNWDLLDRRHGPVLLFVHGIFSSCNGAFGAIGEDQQTWSALRTLYEGRILGFDHPTASVGPEQNARDFLAQIPAGIKVDVDIVCHSRGGLVARALAGQSPEVMPTAGQLNVRNIIFAATPNGGTQITVTDHWEHLINRISSLLTLPETLLPPPVDEIISILAGVLELVKVVGVDVAVSLPGLEDMRPDSDLLARLGAFTGSPPGYHAVASHFVPGPMLKHVFNRTQDLGDLIDQAVFGGVPNDIAVPTNGVWDPRNTDGLVPAPQGTAIPGFPIDAGRRLAIEGSVYWHGAYFDDQAVRDKLVEWLGAASPSTPGGPASTTPA